jgi:superoxide dismutase, Fe-Mn family
MAFSLPDLPYNRSALMPYISEETLDYHYGKHHQTYVNNLNALIEGTPLGQKNLEEIIKSESGSIFNNAAQVWNHTFYWHSMAPKAGGNPHGKALDSIVESFGSFEIFKDQFSKAAAGQFGSGWAWLAQDPKDGRLIVETTANAGCPLTEGHKPILTCDVWEHAYYIDYRNMRAKYIEAWWNLVNWEFANLNLR